MTGASAAGILSANRGAERVGGRIIAARGTEGGGMMESEDTRADGGRDGGAVPKPRARRFWRWVAVGLLLFAFAVRGVGIFRGLERGVQFHPDAPRQVVALGRYLRGQYIWYTGSRFHDGYPLFLNRFDEWIVRAVRGVARPVSRTMGRTPPEEHPSLDDLYRWTMILRLLYGTVVVGLTGWIARRMRWPPWAWAGAMLLVALSPTSVAVTNFATGDMACDLFFAAALLCCAGHASTGRKAWLAGAGGMVAWAFAGKYHGGMAAGMIAAYVALASLWGERRFRRFLGMGLVSGAAFFVALAVAMPQWVWATKRTWRDFLRITAFIRDYGVSDAFLARPWHERAWLAFSSNIGPVLGALGLVVVFLSLVGLVLAVRRLWTLRRDGPEPAAWRRASLAVAAFAFPWAVILFSVSSKLHLHVFYFSWLYPVLALAAVYALVRLVLRPGAAAVSPVRRTVFAVLLLAAAAEPALTLHSDLYYWRREDSATLSRELLRNPVLPGARERRLREVQVAERVERQFLLEPVNVTHFRNRPTAVLSPDAADWRTLAAPPVPVIPFGGEPADWILLNGPRLPRCDAMFHVPARARRRLVVVTHEPLEACWVGLQSGRRPALVRGRIGGAEFAAELAADDWTVVRLEPRPARRRVDEGRSGQSIYHYPITVATGPGDAWVRVLASPAEVEAFRWFGGDPRAEIGQVLDGTDPDRVEELAGRVRYRQGNAWSHVPIAPETEKRRLRLGNGFDVLPAGPYVVEAECFGLAAEGSVARFRLVDAFGRPVPGIEEDFTVPAGRAPVRFAFAKPFAPFECAVEIEALEGKIAVGDWRLGPDVRQVYEAASADPPPGWLRKADPAPMRASWRPVDAVFAGILHVHEVAWPDPVIPGRRQTFGARVSLLRDHRQFRELEVYLHWYAPDRRQLLSIHLPTAHLQYGDEAVVPFEVEVPADAEPGEAAVELGAWNRRTQQRFRPELRGAAMQGGRRRMVHTGTGHIGRPAEEPAP